MKDFETERKALLDKLELLMSFGNDDEIIYALTREVSNLKSPKDLNGLLTRIVIDNLEDNYELGSQIIEFEQNLKNVL